MLGPHESFLTMLSLKPWASKVYKHKITAGTTSPIHNETKLNLPFQTNIDCVSWLPDNKLAFWIAVSEIWVGCSGNKEALCVWHHVLCFLHLTRKEVIFMWCSSRWTLGPTAENQSELCFISRTDVKVYFVKGCRHRIKDSNGSFHAPET